MLLQESGERALQLPGPVAVDQADDALIGEDRFVEEAFGAGNRFVDGAANHVEIRRARVARLQVDVDAHLLRRRLAAANALQVTDAGAHPLAPNVARRPPV